MQTLLAIAGTILVATFALTKAWLDWAGRRQNTQTKILAYVGPVLAILFIIFLVDQAVGGGSGTDHNEVSAQPTVVVTATAQTIEPTQHLAPAVASIAAGLPALTTEECAYLTQLASEYVSPLQDSLHTFVGLTDRAGSDPTLVFDSDWKINMATQFAIWSVSHTRFAALSPPASLAELHAEFLHGLSLLDGAGTLAAQGIDEVDVDKINQASAQITLANDSLGRAQGLLSAFREQHSPTEC